MIILSGRSYLDAIREQMKRSKSVRIAVAFWGDGAETSDGIGLTSAAARAPSVEIICNLTMGGTNPHVIRQLLKSQFVVKHSPRLHAKVFRFDDCAIVGSANASCNGLNFEGDEAITGWQEIGVLFSDAAALTELDKCLDKIVDTALKVDEAALKIAEELWKKRRANRPSANPEFSDQLHQSSETIDMADASDGNSEEPLNKPSAPLPTQEHYHFDFDDGEKTSIEDYLDLAKSHMLNHPREPFRFNELEQTLYCSSTGNAATAGKYLKWAGIAQRAGKQLYRATDEFLKLRNEDRANEFDRWLEGVR